MPNELDELKGTYTKLRQDIEELNKKRSSLQNEIAQKLADNKTKIDLEYLAHCEKMKLETEEMANRRQTLKEKVDFDTAELKKREIEVSNKEAALDKDLFELKKATDDFEVFRTKEIEKILSEKTMLEASSIALSQSQKEIQAKYKELEDYKALLANKDFQVNWKLEQNNKLILELGSERNLLEARLKEIVDERGKLNADKEQIALANLKAIQAQEDLKKLESLKDNILELARKQKEIEAKITEEQELSKALAKKQEDLREQEITLGEKQRLLASDTRKLDDKIQTIQKLRAELNNA